MPGRERKVGSSKMDSLVTNGSSSPPLPPPPSNGSKQRVLSEEVYWEKAFEGEDLQICDICFMAESLFGFCRAKRVYMPSRQSRRKVEKPMKLWEDSALRLTVNLCRGIQCHRGLDFFCNVGIARMLSYRYIENQTVVKLEVKTTWLWLFSSQLFIADIAKKKKKIMVVPIRGVNSFYCRYGGSACKVALTLKWCMYCIWVKFLLQICRNTRH